MSDDVSDDKASLERAVDLLVYAPIGLVLTAREELPRLIDRGRREAAGQVGMARMVGEFAVNRGQKEAGKLFQRATERFADFCGTPVPGGTDQDAAPAAGSDPPGGQEQAATPAAAADRPSPASLAIPGYDSLSAPQVVQRLAGLSAQELEAVRAYEAATRGRKTILSRVAQLQSVAT